MTKTITKIIAGLGVVAGLGIAALPLSTYANTSASKNIPVTVTINDTIGTVEPSCTSTAGQGAAGAVIGSVCEIDGSSNAGITIKLKATSSTALTHSDTSTTIAAIGATANLTDAAFIGGGATEGWGFKFDAGSTANLNVSDTSGTGGTNYGNWNGITASDVVIAKSTAAVTMNGAELKFRTVTPASQKPGVYTGAVTLTVTTP